MSKDNLFCTEFVCQKVFNQMIDQIINISEYRQLEKELETLTQSLCEEVALNNAVSKAAQAVTSSMTMPTDVHHDRQGEPLTTFPVGTSSLPPPQLQTPSPGSIPGPACTTHTAATKDPPLGDAVMKTDSCDIANQSSETSKRG